MKYLIVLITLISCVGCKLREPPKSQFHFKDKININDGFYKGESGIIRSVRDTDVRYYVADNEYTIETDDGDMIYVKEEDISYDIDALLEKSGGPR